MSTRLRLVAASAAMTAIGATALQGAMPSISTNIAATNAGAQVESPTATTARTTTTVGDDGRSYPEIVDRSAASKSRTVPITAAVVEDAAESSYYLSATDPSVVVVNDEVNGVAEPDGALPSQAPEGSITGWDIRDLRFQYDVRRDVLAVEVTSYGIVGDPEGNGDPSAWDETWTDLGLPGEDSADLGAQEDVVVLFDLDEDGQADVIAGVHVDTDINGLSVAELTPGLQAAPHLSIAFGTDLDAIGTVSDSPTADNPSLLFTIEGWSTLAGNDDSLDFAVNAHLGSGIDGNIGEDTLVSLAELVAVDVESGLGDRVFADNNSDGIQDDDEPGIADALVVLEDPAGNELDRTQTDADGNYRFAVGPGDYVVRFPTPANLSPSSADAGDDDALDSDADPVTGRTPTVTVGPGEEISHLDAGFTPFVAAPAVSLEKATDGIDADVSPGPELVVGEEVTFTYVVTNTGNVALADIVITDDVEGEVCSVESLAVGASAQCELVSVVVEGAYANVGSVDAQPVDENGEPSGDRVSATDPSHHTGAEPGPACEPSIGGPRLVAHYRVIDQTGWVAEAGSEIIIDSIEPGASPDQPNEQVYVQVGDDIYGPTPVGLGRLTFTVENTGPVSILHYSVVTGDVSHSNSVEYIWCGDSLSVEVLDLCPDDAVQGPLMWRNGKTDWDSGMTAEPGSTITVVTSEAGRSPGQPHQQVYVRVGDELFGPTAPEMGEMTFTTTAGGEISVEHYSVHNDDALTSNSVTFTLCGDGIVAGQRIITRSQL